ncbi:hypothetical protein HT031_006154 [Scenedesmus sp. PABB004]|nr:hypothetical protein HT031_006154 [Scenedesmus sp. PABB004]
MAPGGAVSQALCWRVDEADAWLLPAQLGCQRRLTAATVRCVLELWGAPVPPELAAAPPRMPVVVVRAPAPAPGSPRSPAARSGAAPSPARGAAAATAVGSEHGRRGGGAGLFRSIAEDTLRDALPGWDWASPQQQLLAAAAQELARLRQGEPASPASQAPQPPPSPPSPPPCRAWGLAPLRAKLARLLRPRMRGAAARGGPAAVSAPAHVAKAQLLDRLREQQEAWRCAAPSGQWVVWPSVAGRDMPLCIAGPLPLSHGGEWAAVRGALAAQRTAAAQGAERATAARYLGRVCELAQALQRGEGDAASGALADELAGSCDELAALHAAAAQRRRACELDAALLAAPWLAGAPCGPPACDEEAMLRRGLARACAAALAVRAEQLQAGGAGA